MTGSSASPRTHVPRAHSPRGLVFFDVDGTLVPSTTSAQHLAKYLGNLDVLAAAEAAYAAGELSNQQVCARDAAGWRGHTVTDMNRWLRDLPLVSGIAETLAWCHGNALQSHVATLAWEPVGRFLARRFGFAGFCGPRLEAVGGRYTGVVEYDFDEHDKAAAAVDAARQVGVPLSACAAVGDSRSDLPLFATVGLSIAFNATPAVRAVAHHAVDGCDLTAILPHLARWLDALTE